MVNNLKFDVVIPARYDSQRLAGKLLADIGGRSMIQRVVECAMASSAAQVIVAVDDKRIAENVAKTTTATVVSTSKHHVSGSDRIAEAVQLLNIPSDRIIVNVQGDEPLMNPELIDHVAGVLVSDREAVIGTAAVPIDLVSDAKDPNRVKCVVDRYNRALYFSRSVIPWTRALPNKAPDTGLHHVGIYAYTVRYLVEQHARRDRCPLEIQEGLEQLRALHHGDKIAVYIDSTYQGFGVDTQADLEQVRNLIASSQTINQN